MNREQYVKYLTTKLAQGASFYTPPAPSILASGAAGSFNRVSALLKLTRFLGSLASKSYIDSHKEQVAPKISPEQVSTLTGFDTNKKST